MLGTARLEVSLDWARRDRPTVRCGSLFVEAELVSDRGRLTASAGAQLGKDAGDVDAGGLGGDEQRLADLTVGPALGDQRKPSTSRRVRPSKGYRELRQSEALPKVGRASMYLAGSQKKAPASGSGQWS
jgi:hypothetical protein